jgi:hypothetical protein
MMEEAPQKGRRPPEATPLDATDGPMEEARDERDLVEGERNDLTNALANRATLYDHRDNSEWEVNPDQTPKPAKTIQPTEYV